MLFNSPLYWGFIIILIGILIIIKSMPVFKNISIARIVFGIILISLGINIIFSPDLSGVKKKFKLQQFNIKELNEDYAVNSKSIENYKIKFSSKVIDLTKLEPKEENIVINADVKFGNAFIKLGRYYQVIISGEANLGSIIMPDGSVCVNNDIYNKIVPEENKYAHSVYLNAETDFGNIKIIRE